MKILVTGSKGQLGKELLKLYSDQNITGVDIDEMDITNAEETVNLIRELNPDIVIHAAAMTDVDGCEKNEGAAYKVNTLGTRNVALACQKANSEMLYVSTDFVFAGDKDENYNEFDIPSPLSVYGKSKLEGEKLVKELLNKFYIVRTAWLYGDGHNFVKTMLSLAENKDSLNIVSDQQGTPTFAKDLAIAISKIIDSGLYGTYHVSNSGSCSWYDFAKKIFEIKGIDIVVNPTTAEEFGSLAERPAYSVMDNFALESQDIYKMREWEEALKDYLVGEKDV
ncbi:dTDP-4-dehydrorhamnose reductase [Halanaerobium sp. MA284_MarDTE_T2]|uniref:dTDP-4-dehydrorhamnose reductase n=1 Tax=Halanaerobium sp. MA284_MarDTE_T2 TaxID=2183913 RepID=UPI000DF222E2|nr:dTDP-4-dehydrorhamnose reductase [Halanaerobium sp. MA284_MarDTE_T2]RCW44757.1 dTDP-4-dehydrorhamnose reductase [Halanaerobium sp. MA284_MarDTE_T2]